MTDEQFERLLLEIRKISRGGMGGSDCEPLGLEAVVMSISGEGKPGHRTITGGIDDVYDKLDMIEATISDGLADIALAIREHQS